MLIHREGEVGFGQMALGRIDQGRGKREEGRGKREEGRGKREEGSLLFVCVRVVARASNARDAAPCSLWGGWRLVS